MNLHLSSISNIHAAQLHLTGSKSETNRLLLLQALYPNLTLENTSISDDSEVMHAALATTQQWIDVHHAGTAMRFLTAFFAVNEGKEVVLTGSSRMQERPIQVLVAALNQLGAQITYENQEGYPPIRIKGKKITASKVSLPAHVSSQYISALLLIAPTLENGLEITLEGEITSLPYIQMTLALLHEIGIATSFQNNTITVLPKSTVANCNWVIESDWSSASYWFSIIAMSKIGTQVTLSSYKKENLQGDSVVVELYKNFGVETVYNDNNSITLTKTQKPKTETLYFQLNNAPDIAQTIAVTCFGLGLACNLTGLHTLKIKETDRLVALKNELTKLGASVAVTNDGLHLDANAVIKSNVTIATYNDHRMAMAFAPLALQVPLIIEEVEVVSKSYPTFWEDLKAVGFDVQPV
jgi:3-phosphoshikimate 1-carboxyvinyltransferase